MPQEKKKRIVFNSIGLLGTGTLGATTTYGAVEITKLNTDFKIFRIEMNGKLNSLENRLRMVEQKQNIYHPAPAIYKLAKED